MTGMPLLPETTPPLTDRATELRVLTEHARNCRSRTSATPVIGGDPGVGKTRLAHEFTATQPPGACSSDAA